MKKYVYNMFGSALSSSLWIMEVSENFGSESYYTNSPSDDFHIIFAN
jgi:hypothetical protein